MELLNRFRSRRQIHRRLQALSEMQVPWWTPSREVARANPHGLILRLSNRRWSGTASINIQPMGPGVVVDGSEIPRSAGTVQGSTEIEPLVDRG